MRRTSLALLTLCCVWLLLVLLTNPVGDFPLNDDWSYGRAVQSLVEHGHLELTGFTSMPLLAQVFWGALFCLPFGFSFTALRISTITLGLVGIVATHQLLNETKADSFLVLLGTLIVAANPLYFQLSLTFMTDVPFFAASMLAFLFLLRTLRTDRSSDLIPGLAFILIAMLIRQLAIVIPLSFLVAYWVKNGASRKLYVNALLPATLFVGLLLAYPTLLRHTIGLPALYNRSYEPIAESATTGVFQIPLIFADRLFVELIYLGLFTLPFLIALGVSLRGAGSSSVKRSFASIWPMLFLVSLAGILVWQHRPMPLGGNVLFDTGLGPVLLRDTYVLGLAHWPAAPSVFWIAVTAAAVLGSALLVRQIAALTGQMIGPRHPESEIRRPVYVFVLSAAGLYSAVIAITGFLDRYLVWLLPLLLACFLLVRQNPLRPSAALLHRSVALILIFSFALFAVAGTHDYLAWNRARWQALTDLMTGGLISYRDIDGGFEFNGWYGYDAKYSPPPPKSWWWVEDDDYVISLGPIPGYLELRRYPFERWIPFGEDDILVLQRIGVSMSSQAAMK